MWLIVCTQFFLLGLIWCASGATDTFFLTSTEASILHFPLYFVLFFYEPLSSRQYQDLCDTHRMKILKFAYLLTLPFDSDKGSTLGSKRKKTEPIQKISPVCESCLLMSPAYESRIKDFALLRLKIFLRNIEISSSPILWCF